MQKIIRLTESDLIKIVRRVINEGDIFKFFSKVRFPKSSAGFVSKFGDDGAKLVDDVMEIAIQRNSFVKNGATFIRSASGAEVSIFQMDEALAHLNAGKSLDDIVTIGGKTGKIRTFFPNFLADRTPFRSVIERAQTFKPKPSSLGTIASNISSIQKKFTWGDAGFIKEWWTIPESKFKDLLNKQTNMTYSSIDDLAEKTLSLKDKSFNASKVKVLDKTIIDQREVLEVLLENNQKILIYRSTGLARKTLPPPGGWSVVPGFITNAYVGGKWVDLWFIKTTESINLTHTHINGGGANKYLTELSQFLEKNGSQALSR